VPKLLGAKVVLDLHDPMPELMTTIFRADPTSLAVRVLKRLERWSIAFADSVVTVNVACRKIFEGRSCPPGKVHVVMNAPDEAFFAFRAPSHAPVDPARPYAMMYHGSILERNGLDIAVEALALVRRSLPRAELRIYGDPTGFLDRVMALVRERGLQDAVHSFGGRPPQDIVTAIDQCDVGLIPNRRNVFTEINTPTRIFEYLSRGKPVITGRAPGVLDYFGEEELFFFELGDAADLARVITRISGNPSEVEPVVKRGQTVYLAHRWSDEPTGLVE